MELFADAGDFLDIAVTGDDVEDGQAVQNSVHIPDKRRGAQVSGGAQSASLNLVLAERIADKLDKYIGFEPLGNNLLAWTSREQYS